MSGFKASRPDQVKMLEQYHALAKRHNAAVQNWQQLVAEHKQLVAKIKAVADEANARNKPDKERADALWREIKAAEDARDQNYNALMSCFFEFLPAIIGGLGE